MLYAIYLTFHDIFETISKVFLFGFRGTTGRISWLLDIRKLSVTQGQGAVVNNLVSADNCLSEQCSRAGII